MKRLQFEYAITVLALLSCPANGQELNATVAGQSGEFAQPWDATPDPDGGVFFFTAIGPNGPGVFRVASIGGPTSVVAAGSPFVSPIGISISTDGKTLYVADQFAWAGRGETGQIFAVPAAGGAARPLRGAEGRGSRGIQVFAEGGQDVIYFTGYRPSDRTPGVYRLPAAGADSPTVVFEGAPMVEPQGVTINRAGVVFITDRAATPFSGSVYKIDAGVISRVVETIRPGNPAGIALSFDESKLLVSTLQPYRNRAQVLIVDLTTLDLSTTNRGMEQIPGAGGLHRAYNGEIYSWCGSPMGPVFKIMRGGI